MDKFSYAIGLGIGQNLLSMGAQSINVEDFAQAIKDVLDRKETAISHNEAREIVNKYFEELETKLNAENIEKGKTAIDKELKRLGLSHDKLFKTDYKFTDGFNDDAQYILITAG